MVNMHMVTGGFGPDGKPARQRVVFA